MPTFADDRARLAAARQQLEILSRRRSVRDFSDQTVDESIIQTAIRTATMAPSGANQQPWHFAVVRSKEIRQKIRRAAEAEEQAFYSNRAPQQWLDALAPIGTDANKPFLETAPYLIAVFYQAWGIDDDGSKIKHYYPVESIGLASGFLISALTAAGLATLTHTPSPMNFLRQILSRPENERPFILLVVGHPAPDATVPKISKLDVDAVSSWH
ncbi:MAG: nitroreductase family protein [Planctomycetota bacterium]